MERIPYLVDLFNRVLFGYAKGFDREHWSVILFIGEPPNISESSIRERSIATDAERGGDFVVSGKDPMQAACLP